MPWKALLWYVVSIVVIIGAAYWVTRKLAEHGMGGLSGRMLSAKIEPIAQLNVGKNERLLLAAVGERYFLLGITAGGVSNLAEFTKEEAEQWKASAAELPAPKTTFAQTMNTLLKKKGRGE